MSRFMFSVVVCTHSRSALLTDVIASVCQQAYPREAYEILVADNPLTDETGHVVERLDRLPAHLAPHVYEPRACLLHARNAGAKWARGEVVAYIDDGLAATPGSVLPLAKQRGRALQSPEERGT